MSSVPPPPPPPISGWGDHPGAPEGGYAPALDFAGFGTRLGGLLIDSVIATAAGFPGWLILNAADDRGAMVALGGVLIIAGVVAWIVVYARMMGSTGQSPGCKVMGMKVVDRRTLEPIGAGRVVGRYLFASVISGSLCYLGYLWMLWDERKQTWQDKVVGSIVLKI